MGCGTSRSQESRPSSPPAALQPGGGVNEAKEAKENKVSISLTDHCTLKLDSFVIFMDFWNDLAFLE